VSDADGAVIAVDGGESGEKPAFGTLTEVQVRDYWETEDRDFTPWLAAEWNMKLLADAIEMELEPPFKTEEPIGPFRADIVAKEGDGIVIVENQLSATDHKHLGQLMVYATNRRAKAVVWIATRITDEYRKVLDWLNDNTPETIVFYGLEVELWRIGDSLPAPRFNVVCKPNELTKIESGGGIAAEPTETKLLQLEFWQALREVGVGKNLHLSFRKPRPQHWYSFAVGRSGFQISLNAKTMFAKEVTCELYIAGRANADLAFELLEEQKEEIENKLGELEWMPLPGKGACRIIQRRVANIEDRDSWSELIDWCLDRAEAFHVTFSSLVAALDLEGSEEEEREKEPARVGLEVS
jgi:Domain of unknown function (DUF4268)